MSEIVSLVAMVKKSIPSHLLHFTMNPLNIPHTIKHTIHPFNILYIHSTYHTSIQQYICPFRCRVT